MCPECALPTVYCVCSSRPQLEASICFCLLMDSREPSKSSNTGRLIKSCLAETKVFIWSRTQPDQGLMALLESSYWQPYLIFPGEYAAPHQQVVEALPASARRPLLIILDATWLQARKIFRKSPYLQALPVLSLPRGNPSAYRLRRSREAAHLCTAEVAIACLGLAGEKRQAELLDDYFETFSTAWLAARDRKAIGNQLALNVV